MRDDTLPQQESSSNRNGPTGPAVTPPSSQSRRRRSFRFNLGLLVLAIAVPALILAGFLAALWAINERQDTGEAAVDFARALSQDLDRQAASVLAMLSTLAAATGPNEDLLVFEERMRRVTAIVLGLPEDDGGSLEFVVRDGNGAVMRGGASETAEDADVWRDALAPTLDDRRPYATDMVRTSNGLFIGIAVPIDIEPNAALVLQVPLAMIAGSIGQPPADWIVAIFDRQGMTLARSHEPERFVGDAGREDVVEAIQATNAGVMENISRENVALYNAFDRSEVTGWSAVVGVPRARLAAPFWNAALSVAAIAVLLALLGAIVAIYFQRRLSRSIATLAGAADRMGIDSELAIPRLEIAELDQIGTAMARTSAGLIEERRHQQQMFAEMALTEKVASRLAAIVESSEDAILAKDLGGIITSWNSGAESLFGYSAAEAIGKPVTMLIPDDRTEEEQRILTSIRRGERIEPYETIRQRKDGSSVDISLSASPIRDAAGNVVGVSTISRDITAKKKAEEQQNLLLREMNHRVKNLFTLAGSVVSLSANWTSDPKDLARDVRERLAALSRAHALTLASDPLGHGRDVPVSMHSLIRTILEPYRTDGGERIEIHGVDLPIGRSMTAIALLLHEFATNAAKYGALSVPEGRVTVSCTNDGDTYVLTWHETGGPNADLASGPEGFGTTLATSTVTTQLGGEISREWLESGLRIRLAVPRRKLCD